MRLKQIIFYVFLVNVFFVVSAYSVAKLEFVNNTEKVLNVKLVDWKRQYGPVYRLESPRLVASGATLSWSPDVKPEIKQNVLEIYGENKKLIEKINIKSYKNASAPAGYERKISYAGAGIYEDTLQQKGKKLSKIVVFGTDLLEKTREAIIDATYKVFEPIRKPMREKKDKLNPEPYDIINQNPYARKDAKVRIGGTVACEEEKKVFKARLKVVKKAQEKFLGIKFKEDQKPLVVAFVFSGGGQRARLCSAGSAAGAQQIGLRDCGMHEATLSGSTWFLAPALISQMPINDYLERAVKESKKDLGFYDLVVDVKYALDVLQTKFAFAQPIGAIDIYGFALSSYYLRGFGQEGNLQRCYLSSIAENEELKDGLLPIPVFTAVTAESGLSHVWCEFTPWEFGSRWFGKSGAYIPTWAFGRTFESLNHTKNWGTEKRPLYEPEQTLGFMMGIWGSAPAATCGQIYDQVVDAMKNSPTKKLLELVLKKTDLKKIRFVWAEVNNFMYNWSESEFSKYKYLKLADAGVKFINPIFSTYRRPADGKNIKDASAPDVIIIWDSGASGAKKELQMQVQYANKRNLPFPEINFDVVGQEVISIFTKNPDPKKFKDYEIPTVIYMKKMIDKNLLEKYIEDPKLGDMVKRLEKFDLEECMKGICGTFNFKYEQEQDGVLLSQMLVDMAKFNTIVSAEKIKTAMLDRIELNKRRDSAKGFAASAQRKEDNKVIFGSIDQLDDKLGQKECVICQEKFTAQDQDLAKLPCGHIFHRDCIYKWLKEKRSCPVCRKEQK